MPDERDGLLRRFLVASRHGEIVALINAARSEDDLGAVVATELCEAYDAEIGFALIARPGSTTPEVIGCVGLVGDDLARIPAQDLCRQSIAGADAVRDEGTDLLGLGIRNLALAPHTAGGARLLVGVGRLYDQQWEALELALLDAVTKSAAQALERFGLERQLERAHDMEGVAGVGEIRAAAASAAELVEQLQALSRRHPPQPTLDVDALEPRTAAESPSLPPDPGSLAHLFRLLGHPIRLRILHALGSETLSPSELEERLGVGLALVAYHVGVLRDDDLLTLVETRARRGALESFYRLTGQGELARHVLAAASRAMNDTAAHP